MTAARPKVNFSYNVFMMIPQSCCVFPDTLPKDETLFPLVQFFAEAVYIAAAENDLPRADELSPLAGWLLAQGLLRFHCPAPLGADQERFLALLKELRQRPGDCAALALAGMQGSGSGESSGAILSAVRRQSGSAAAEDAELASRLWQARLVLKLGESADRQEEDIRQSLRRITLREQGLLRVLLNEDAAAPPAAAELPASAGSRRTRLRLKAWRNLLAWGSQPLPACVFVTADRDAFELLLEESGGTARPVLQLPLPAVLADSDFAAQRTAFRAAAAGLISELSQQPTAFPAEAWNRLLEEQYPAAAHGRCLLSLLHQEGSRIFGILEQP